MSLATQFEISTPPGDVISAVKFAPNSPNRLLVSSWDKNLHLYEIQGGENASGTLVNKYEHRGPVLDTCFGASDDEAFTAGMDWQVKRIDLSTGEQTVLSTHEAPANRVVYSKEHSLLISSSWDSTLHFHFLSDPSKGPTTISLPAKPFSLSLSPTRLVVAMASRLVNIYDLKSTALLSSEATEGKAEVEPWQKRESSLKFMTRAVACMPNDAGYATSSIEGRVAVEWFDPSDASQARKYAFKCHRQPDSSGDGSDIVYPVNSLTFNPIHGTFASGGGDGVVALWDAVAKRRIRQYQKYATSVAALSFSTDGKFLAIGVSPGFEDGKEFNPDGLVKVFIRELARRKEYYKDIDQATIIERTAPPANRADTLTQLSPGFPHHNMLSTTAVEDPSTDKSCDILKDVFKQEAGGQWEWDVVETKIVGDVVEDIQEAIKHWAGQDNPVNVIITTGGTGFAVADITPEAVSPLLHRQAPGLVYGMLSSSAAITPFALMSRPVAGVRDKSIIITLPGSPKGAKENLQSVLKLLPHACLQAAGANSRSLHAGGIKKLESEAGISSTGAHAGHHHGHSHGHGHSHAHGHSHSHKHDHGHAMPIRHTTANDNPQSNDPSAGPSRRHRSSPYPTLEVSRAIELIKNETPAPQIITAKVDGSLVGFVLAEDVTATEAVPAYRASIVDGYAVIAPEGGESSAGVFPVASVSHATPGEIKPLLKGQITRITTGAPLPPGATSVIMVEDTVLKSTSDDGTEEKEVEILATDVKAGENIREVGSDIKSGSVILQKGDQISATGGELGLLVSVGRTEVKVYRRPVVGVLSTGDEIVQHDRPGPLRLGEVRDCNRPTIMAAVRGWGFEARDLGIASDTPGSLEETLRAALRQVDVIITSGGVSMGELDLLKPTIERQLGGTIHFGRVAMKPGKPSTFATVPVKSNDGAPVKKLVFSLPGNPASAVVALHLFVLPSLHFACGVQPAGLPSVPVQLGHEIRLDKQRKEYHRAVVSVGRNGRLMAVSTGAQRSSMVGSLKSANALLCLPIGDKIGKGEEVQALLMGAISAV
ncbi:hypothetical protein V492_07627 [Pseudogymnoascus sp. VKM F-4246]|nr:hypothetical protein V492_07627 [Pseudogymnoascus sp. VKM F-4246]